MADNRFAGEVGPTFASPWLIPATREGVADLEGMEHVPDDLRNAPPGIVVNAKAERGARAGRSSNRRDSAAAEQDRLAFLTEASRRMAASLDYESTLTTIAGTSSSYLDAWVIVDVVDDGGEIRRLTVQHPDPDKQDAARAFRERYRPLPNDLPDVTSVIREGRTAVASDISADALAEHARDHEQLALLDTLGTHAFPACRGEPAAHDRVRALRARRR